MRKLKYMIFIVILFIIDLFSKYYVVNKYGYYNGKILLENYFNIFVVKNYGAAFSIFSDKRWIFLVLSTIFIVLALYVLVVEFQKEKNVTGEALVIVGGICNMIDRIYLGYVRDFLEVPFFSVMNFADWFISLGVFIILIKVIISKDFKEYGTRKRD